MGVRDRLAAVRSNLASNVSKVFGSNEPAAMAAGEAAAGMTPATPFSPGTPIGPYDGYSRTPRSQDFVTGYNIAARPRSHERVAFETLRGLVESYDVAQMCIWHRIDSIRSLEWSLVTAKGYDGDVTDAIPAGMAALEKPDRQTPFSVWLAEYLYDILAYDAGTLYRMRNRRGDAIGLRCVDGTSIAPLLDYWGNRPAYPAEAYVQYVQGLPWNWLTDRDLIYVPFRKRTNSPYGTAPLESILLNANTDLRFQAYFLQRFTEGNIPEAFASAPETWSPNQIEQFQEYWDAFMLGDQSVKNQIKWIPGGSTIAWSNEKEFSDTFSLFLMRKTAAAYHVVPADLGFTENVNRSSGESQADVQHRVGDLPLLRHVQGILTDFLRNDLGLPLAFAFDLGEEQADRLEQAQADKVYVEMGAVSASDVRELRYGLPEPDGVPVPRFVYTTRSGPIPLSALYGVAGQVDPLTAAPVPGAPLPHTVFGGVEGTSPSPPIQNMPLAEQLYGTSAMPPAPPPQPPAPAASVAKDGDGGAPTEGITSGTGIVGYDLVGRDDEDDSEDSDGQRLDLVKAEVAAFRRYRKARRRSGVWRDFEFRYAPKVEAHRLNDAGRLAVRKAAGEVAVAGLAVRAADTGRVLMLQRALDDEDPAAGFWECPGGHLDQDETPLQAAVREWQEETGLMFPAGEQTGTWVSADGVYQGIVWTVPSEACVPVDDRGHVSNPDDPDGDQIEAIAWWDPARLPGNPAVRPELLASIDDVLAALGQPGESADDGKVSKESVNYRLSADPNRRCGTCSMYGDNRCSLVAGIIDPGDVCDEWDPRTDDVTKAGVAAPKGSAGSVDDWPGWALDERCADHWAPLIAAATAGTLTTTQARRIVRDYRDTRPGGDHDGRTALVAAVALWLAERGVNPAARLGDVLAGLYADGYLIGAASARAVVDGGEIGTLLGDWVPGDTAAAEARIVDMAMADGYAVLLTRVPDIVGAIDESRRKDLARALIDGADDDPDVLAETLQQVLDDADKAATVALTEVVGGSSAGAVGAYEQMGVTEYRWVVDPSSNVCPACAGNAAIGPLPVGDPFPSSGTPPLHPRCRCSVMPA